MRKNENKKVRCCIYTRKSIEEGLDMSFNTLDAQREAGENYIASQKANGWVCLPERYDDGGFSGGNLDRPAFNRMKEDIIAGKIDMVVVYKLDRLSRSLLDFMSLQQFFETHGVAFCSVTQPIDTSNSAGKM
ncbi:MAG: recombinase family protein, partial [Lentisphaeria bacterium]|nr:recombinase family protein [Lentisphaeria bacterium]